MAPIFARIKWDKREQGNWIAVADAITYVVNSHSPLLSSILNLDVFGNKPSSGNEW